MLVLSRRTDEKIIFPTIATRLQVVAIKAGLVRLGIDAPASLPIYREELLERGPFAEAATHPAPPSPDEVRQHRHRQLVRSAMLRVLDELDRLRRRCASEGVAPVEADFEPLETELRRLELLLGP